LKAKIGAKVRAKNPVKLHVVLHVTKCKSDKVIKAVGFYT
jgi:hypothetical protein